MTSLASTHVNIGKHNRRGLLVDLGYGPQVTEVSNQSRIFLNVRKTLEPATVVFHISHREKG
jgi:hypothetical protein